MADARLFFVACPCMWLVYEDRDTGKRFNADAKTPHVCPGKPGIAPDSSGRVQEGEP